MKNNWEEDLKMRTVLTPDKRYIHYEQAVAFIRSLLSQQRQEFAQVLEGMKYPLDDKQDMVSKIYRGQCEKFNAKIDEVIKNL